MGLFNDSPVRENNTFVDANWWNVLRLAGIALENFVGIDSGVVIPTTSFTVANNQASAANVTGLSFDGTVSRSFEVSAWVYRNTTSTGATELAENVKLYGIYSAVAGTWEMAQEGAGTSGVLFTITNAGQVQYTSSNITGTASHSSMKFRATTIGV